MDRRRQIGNSYNQNYTSNLTPIGNQGGYNNNMGGGYRSNYQNPGEVQPQTQPAYTNNYGRNFNHSSYNNNYNNPSNSQSYNSRVTPYGNNNYSNNPDLTFADQNMANKNDQPPEENGGCCCAIF